MSAEAEFRVGDLPAHGVRTIVVSQEHRAEIAELFEKREQLAGVRRHAFELHHGATALDQPPCAGEDAELMAFDIAFDEARICQREIVENGERDRDRLIA